MVTCSWPRAELTTLSYAVMKTAGPLATRLKVLSENQERARLIADVLATDGTLPVQSYSDQAAVARMAVVLKRPREELREVYDHLRASLRRLYRQRNMVLHGGKTRTASLRSTLWTAAPIVGAGFDRIAHAHLVEKIAPRQLAAQARLRLAHAGIPGEPHVSNLLGQ